MTKFTSVIGVLVASSLLACDGTVLLPPAPAPPAQLLHRLNRLEYNNTVRDLLGTALRPAEAFPPDGESDGFDNISEVLQLTPGLLDGYYRAARVVVDDALDEHPAFEIARQHDELGINGGYPVGELWALSGNPIVLEIDVPAGGATVTLIAGASQIGPAPVPQLSFEIDGALIATFVVNGGGASPVPHFTTVDFEPGLHTLRYTPTNFVNDAVANTSNNVLVRALTVASDQRVQGPGRDRVFVCDPESAESPEDCYRVVMTNFASRAWRRPVTAAEASGLAGLWDDLRAGGEAEEAALRLVMRAILTSPKFIYRARTLSDDDSKGWLDDYVLASRLSYFLWSSMPDQRLLAAAAEGRLSSEEGLAEAVTWMLADEKAQGLLDGFAEQWLSLRLLRLASPSAEVYPSFDETLRDDMIAESKEFFADFLYNGQPLTSMLRPDFAYLSNRLAEHYGVAAIDEEGLIRVPASDSERSGLLSLSAWLTANSDSEHSSPIRRGHWLSERILCQPVPPPPAGLVIEPVDLSGDASVREKLEQHRNDPTCAGCHALLDVLGMGFEEFDGIGRVRTEPGIDMLGKLPDGSTFEGANELASLVDEKTFTSCVTQKLLTYALGRSLVSVDLDGIDRIAEQAVAEGMTLPELILAIVSTPAFRSPGLLQEDGQ